VRATVCGHDFDVDLGYVDASEAVVREQLGEYEAGERDAFDRGVRYPAGFPNANSVIGVWSAARGDRWSVTRSS